MLSKSKGTWISPPEADAFFKLFDEFNGNSMTVSAVFLILIIFAFATYFKSSSKTINSISDQTSFASTRLSLVLLSTWILISFLIPFLLSVLRFPIFHSRYMISFLPSYLIIAALGFDAVPKFGLRSFLIIVIVFYSSYNLFSTRSYYNTRSKSDFRGVSQFVVDHSYEKPLVITTLPYHFEYYFREYKDGLEFRYESPTKYLDDLRTGVAPKKAFWWVDAHGRTFNPDSASLRYLDSVFVLATEYSGFDAWAKFFVPKEPENDRLVLNIKGSEMVPSAANIANERGQLYCNGRLEKIVERLDSGSYELIVKASGEPQLGISGRRANMRLKINQVIDTSYCPSNRSFLHGDSFRFKQNTRQPLAISIEFLNDTVENSRDLNLLIRELEILKHP
jgi:hypothetical protein